MNAYQHLLVVWGIKPLLPIENPPNGKIRIRMRVQKIGMAYVRSGNVTTQWVITYNKPTIAESTHFRLIHRQGLNATI